MNDPINPKEHAADCGVFDSIGTVMRRGCTCQSEKTAVTPVARVTVSAIGSTNQPLCEVREPEVRQLTDAEMDAVTGKWTLVTEGLPPASREGHDYLGIVEWEEGVDGNSFNSQSTLVLHNATPTRPVWRYFETVYYNPLGSTPLWQALEHTREWVKVIAWMAIPKVEQVPGGKWDMALKKAAGNG